MTTSEFIIGHSADDANDRRQELRKIFWALLAALIIHLVIGYSLAVSSGLFATRVIEEEEKPMELTLVDLPQPADKKKNTMFIETPESKQVPEPPKEQTFESNANSRAASESNATGEMPLPSQEGKDRPSLDFESHQYSLANPGAVQPQPKTEAQTTPQPTVAPTPTPTPKQDQLAMLTSTPTPTPQPRQSSTPQQQASSYRQYQERTRLTGRITTRGISSVNALGTPLGRYQKALFDAIGSRWYAYVEGSRDLINIGTVRVVFNVDATGHIRNVKVVEKSANEASLNVALQSIQEAKVPPMPDDLAATLPSEGLTIDIPFTIFGN